MCMQQDRDGSAVRVGSQTWMEIPDGEEQGWGYGDSLLRGKYLYVRVLLEFPLLVPFIVLLPPSVSALAY